MISFIEDRGGAPKKPHIKITGILGDPFVTLNLYAIFPKQGVEYWIVVAHTEAQARELFQHEVKQLAHKCEFIDTVISNGPHVVTDHGEAFAFGTQVAARHLKEGK